MTEETDRKDRANALANIFLSIGSLWRKTPIRYKIGIIALVLGYGGERAEGFRMVKWALLEPLGIGRQDATLSARRQQLTRIERKLEMLDTLKRDLHEVKEVVSRIPGVPEREFKSPNRLRRNGNYDKTWGVGVRRN